MSADTSPDADASDLRERIRELEEAVAQQQEHLERMMPSRRQALKAGGAALAGVSLYGAGAASAGTNQVGTIGTASSPVDVQAEDIVATTVDTDDLSIGSQNQTPRMRWMNNSKDSDQTMSDRQEIITFGSAERDDFSAWDSSNSKFVVPETGLYLNILKVRVDGLNDGEYIQIYQQKNGANHLKARDEASPNGVATALLSEVDYAEAAGQEWRFNVETGSTTNATIQSPGQETLLQIIQLDERDSGEI